MVMGLATGVHYLTEVGVKFRHLAEEEEHLDCEAVYTYTWEQVATGRKGVSRVAVLGGPNDFNRLLTHWNRSPQSWKFA